MRGFTAVEWLFSITILGCAAGLLALFACGDEPATDDGTPSPGERAISKVVRERDKVRCLNNLRNIAGLLLSDMSSRLEATGA